MIFNKKKDKMIDVRELARRGVVNLSRPETEDSVPNPANKEGFIDMSQTNSEQSTTRGRSTADFFNMDSAKTEGQFSVEQDGYNKREVDAKMIELDNKIYKLEQRVELLEKKVGVNQPDNNGGLIGW